MNNLGKMAVGMIAATAAIVASANASFATTVDFSSVGLADAAAVTDDVGDVLGTADFTYRSLKIRNPWGVSAVEADQDMYYAAANYSSDGAIIANDATSPRRARGEVSLAAEAGKQITSFDVHFGSFNDVSRGVTYKVFDESWNLIARGRGIVGASGLTVALAVVASELHFQFGNNNRVGVREVNYQMEESNSAISLVPIPGALLLFGSGLLGLAGVSLRQKKAA